MDTNIQFMGKAIKTAKLWFEAGEYPIGSVVVKDWEIISIWEVRRKRDEDPTQHAEIVAIRNACKKLWTRNLQWCILYST